MNETVNNLNSCNGQQSATSASKRQKTTTQHPYSTTIKITCLTSKGKKKCVSLFLLCSVIKQLLFTDQCLILSFSARGRMHAFVLWSFLYFLFFEVAFLST